MIQVQPYAKMVKFDWLGEGVRDREGWRCASMEYGVQCVLMNGMKLLLVLSVVNSDTSLETIVRLVHIIITCTYDLSFCDQGIAPWISPPLFNNTACSENHSVLLQCIDMHNISFYDCENNTAGVICEIPSPDNTTSLTMTTSVSAWVN